MIGEVGGGGTFFSPGLAIFTAKARAAEDRDVLGIALALLSIANARARPHSSLRDSGTGTIPVQCHVALRGTEGVFAHPFGEARRRLYSAGDLQLPAGQRPGIHKKSGH